MLEGEPRKGENKMKQNLKVELSKTRKEDGVVFFKTITIRERILRLLFGEKQRIMLIVPGESVEKVTIDVTE